MLCKNGSHPGELCLSPCILSALLLKFINISVHDILIVFNLKVDIMNFFGTELEI